MQPAWTQTGPHLNPQMARCRASGYASGTTILLRLTAAMTCGTVRHALTRVCAFLKPMPLMLGRKSQPASTQVIWSISRVKLLKLSTAGGRGSCQGIARLKLHGWRCGGSASQYKVTGSERGSSKCRLWTRVERNTAAGRLLSGAKQLWKAAEAQHYRRKALLLGCKVLIRPVGRRPPFDTASS